MRNFLAHRIVKFIGLFMLLFGLLVVCWPIPSPDYPASTVVTDSKGNLLSAAVASDGQWRFPKPDSVPFRVRECITYFEDEYFYWHPGINPVSLARATWQNIRAQKVVSGASTIQMQIARMLGNKRRTLGNKLSEMIVALKLGLFRSKKDLMIQYAAMAPFGGNVVGLEAASWRFFGRPPHLLSWAEAATLAVLPNNPGSIFPGTHDSLLIHKRNRLLWKLKEKSVIDVQTYTLALLEPVPAAPVRIPSEASHLLTTFSKKTPGTRLSSTLHPFWQSRVSALAESHHERMMENGVDNLAALVIDLSSGSVLAYKGNTDDQRADAQQVDMIQSARSPGSSLKPLLFAAALDRGLINRKTLLSDVPSFFGGFSPKNFNQGHSGVVPANVALSRSLNIPFVQLLQTYTYEQFHQDLRDWGFYSLTKPAGHYGLTLVLGGCEVTLWELAQMYFSMYRKLAGLPNRNIYYSKESENKPSLALGEDAIWQTFQTMTTLARPEGEKGWRTFSSSQVIAWKTGTSHGFRDAWAVGINGNVLVLVWVGNADGEGRADLTGIKAAAPLMHSILRLSPNDPNWLKKMKPVMAKARVCTVSGMLANAHCPAQDTEVTTHSLRSGPCPYHKQFVMDESATFRVSGDCYALHKARQATFFVLPPVQGHYYRQEVPDYQGMPPLHPACTDTRNPIGIVYPNHNSKVFIPIEMDETKGMAVFKATHQVTSAELFWHIDDAYIGKTTLEHQQAVWLPPGNHLLTVVDADGNRVSRAFEVIGDNR